MRAYSSWTSTEWNYDTDYGNWYIQSFSNCPSVSDNSKCSQILFEPDDDAINNLYGKNVTMWIRGTRTLGNQHETKEIKLVINGLPLSSPKWNVEGSGNLTTGNQLEYTDIIGTASIFKKKENAFTVDVNEEVLEKSSYLKGNFGEIVFYGFRHDTTVWCKF